MSTQKIVLLTLVAALVVFLFLKGRGDVGVEEAKSLVSEGATLLDVRTEGEFSGGHIDGAVNIPLHELAGRVGELPKAEHIVIYCRSGNRSGQAMSLLKNAGFTRLHNFGAMSRW